MHAAGSLVCLSLAMLALTLATDQPLGRPWDSALAWAGVVLTGVSVVVFLVRMSPTVPTRTSLVEVVAQIGLASSWFGVGLMASRREGTQSWAGRVAPLLGCLGVVELLLSLEHLQPGSWKLPAAALLASIAMITAQCAYVDLVESTGRADRAARPLTVPRSVLPDDTRLDFDVASAIAWLAGQERPSGQEIWLRGDSAVAHGSPAMLTAALGELLANAERYAPQSSVTVHVLAIGSRVEVAITDRGPGLTAAVAERALRAVPDPLPGRSSGLVRARSLMVDSGGTLQLRSRIGGASFVLSLPAALPTAPLAASPAASSADQHALSA